MIPQILLMASIVTCFACERADRKTSALTLRADMTAGDDGGTGSGGTGSGGEMNAQAGGSAGSAGSMPMPDEH
jgi:hypothetical protein